MPTHNNKTAAAPRNTMTACNSILQSILESINRLAENTPSPASPSTELINSLQSLNESMQIVANNIVTLNANVAKIADSLPTMENINTNIASLTSRLNNHSNNTSNITTPTSLPTPTTPISNSDSNPNSLPENSRNLTSPDISIHQPSPGTSRHQIDSVRPSPDQEAMNIKTSISRIWN